MGAQEPRDLSMVEVRAEEQRSLRVGLALGNRLESQRKFLTRHTCYQVIVTWQSARIEELTRRSFIPEDSADSKELKRRRVVASAAELFAHHGYRKTSIDDGPRNGAERMICASVAGSLLGVRPAVAALVLAVVLALPVPSRAAEGSAGGFAEVRFSANPGVTGTWWGLIERVRPRFRAELHQRISLFTEQVL